MEFSHRALGNRSILADPRYANTKNVINKAVKYRENFRPFAPSVLGEKACEIFEINKGKKIEYMEKAVIVRKKLEKKYQQLHMLMELQEYKLFLEIQI